MKRRLPLLRRRRLRRAVLRALRGSFRYIGRVSPSLSARLAEHLFRTPPRYPRLKREEHFLALARRSGTPFPGGPLPTWTWGKGPAVLLVHGWGGQAGRLTPFVGPLTRAGFSVVAFDAPAHGGAPGRHSALPEFVDAVRAVEREHGPFEAAIGHSLGAAACALAVRGGLDIRSVVLLAPPADPEKYSGRFAKFFGIPAGTRDAMKKRLVGRYRTEWAHLRVSGGPGSSRARLLVFHDPRDWKVPIKDGLEIVASWPRAELVQTPGLGHHRIVRDPAVIANAVAFLSGKTATRRVARSPRRKGRPLRPALVS
ncbi:MAG: alpha/beta fold hydrolase [Acidobacteriota bacterium]